MLFTPAVFYHVVHGEEQGRDMLAEILMASGVEPKFRLLNDLPHILRGFERGGGFWNTRLLLVEKEIWPEIEKALHGHGCVEKDRRWLGLISIGDYVIQDPNVLYVPDGGPPSGEIPIKVMSVFATDGNFFIGNNRPARSSPMPILKELSQAIFGPDEEQEAAFMEWLRSHPRPRVEFETVENLEPARQSELTALVAQYQLRQQAEFNKRGNHARS